MVTQISVFMENSKGRLAKLTRLLGDAGIDLKAVSVADTTGFGIFRAIVEDPVTAREILREGGYHATLTQVLGVKVANVPGGLARVLDILSEGGVSVEYLYSYMNASPEEVLILINADRPEHAQSILAENGIGTV